MPSAIFRGSKSLEDHFVAAMSLIGMLRQGEKFGKIAIELSQGIYLFGMHQLASQLSSLCRSATTTPVLAATSLPDGKMDGLQGRAPAWCRRPAISVGGELR